MYKTDCQNKLEHKYKKCVLVNIKIYVINKNNVVIYFLYFVL